MLKIRTLVILFSTLSILYSCGVKKPVVSVTPAPRSAGSIQGAYIDKYKGLAVSEMKRSGVPASITLAQGMLESDYGRSRLATQANNHFGIKCGSNWRGATISHTDDSPNECFRRYRSVEESFHDHSNFLTSSARYGNLFKLHPTDYKGWARGLREAGYATNPNYANLLIRIIEENELWHYDSGNTSRRVSGTTANTKKRNVNEIAVSDKMSRVRENNRIRYIIVNEIDTRESIERDFNLLRRQLSRYNELDNNFIPQPGQILYLQPKRNKAEAGKNVHDVVSGNSMYSISQQYGIKLDKLYKMNRMREIDIPRVGDRLWLRGMRPVK
jgi:LysM repeat protein